MSALTRTALAGCALVAIVLPVQAADLIPPPAPIPAAVLAGWYLRGDIGMTNQEVDSLENVLFDDTDDLEFETLNFESGMSFGLGIGYVFNNWFRVDVTGEYRGETEFHGLDTWTDDAGFARFNDYTAKKSEWVALLNAYLDLGSWHGLSPFVGAGVGAANVDIRSFRDAGIEWIDVDPDPVGELFVSSPTLAFADDNDDWNFAWALYAGLGFDVTDAVTVELAYRYLDMGDGESGDIETFDGVNNVDNPMEFEDLTSHDVKLGVRYMFW
jgi:opacity protein-like surface antigen